MFIIRKNDNLPKISFKVRAELERLSIFLDVCAEFKFCSCFNNLIDIIMSMNNLRRECQNNKIKLFGQFTYFQIKLRFMLYLDCKRLNFVILK